MTSQTPLPTLVLLVNLLASYRPVRPFPANGDRRAKREWFTDRRHNIMVNIAFCENQLRSLTVKDELYLTYCDVKRQGSTALRTVAVLMRPTLLKNFKLRLDRFDSQCGTLLASMHYLFLLLDPTLEGRLPPAL